ncbi:uncharacterized protein LOC116299308 isoform X2 [Actinia tenebrosa]|uniref:Uncharacterized protein LOC116299308 isoform X2 n=1 Tax=Actinia tenebrosa TaxID=6105 RepID=A0A6P8I993_ACTTE|nr:uncharacterized protein LOC116299308 isoform X2 [Actinia tenebrosa]
MDVISISGAGISLFDVRKSAIHQMWRQKRLLKTAKMTVKKESLDVEEKTFARRMIFYLESLVSLAEDSSRVEGERLRRKLKMLRVFQEVVKQERTKRNFNAQFLHLFSFQKMYTLLRFRLKGFVLLRVECTLVARGTLIP